MNIVKRTIGAVALAAVAAVGYGDDAIVGSGAEDEVVSTGAIAQGALDLSEGWIVTDFGPMDIPYSAVGWDIEENGASGWTVTLDLVPAAGGSVSTVASSMTGRGTNVWDTGSVLNGAYVLRHSVRKSGTEDPFEALEAYLVFDRSAVRPLETLAAVAEAVFPDKGRSCTVTAMSGANWTAVGFAGEGIAGPATGMATLTFSLDGNGSLAFEYQCAAGETLTVAVDGGEPQALAAAADWTEVRLAFGDASVHTVVVSAAGGGTAVRGVRWMGEDCSAGLGQVGGGAVDLREGALVVRRPAELMPFTWSSTNFTGVVEIGPDEAQKIDPMSVASVRVVQVTGEGEDVSQWTTEVTGTAKPLLSEKRGEGAIKWKGVRQGVWKVEFVIRTDGSETYSETRILDLRKYIGQGTVFFVI